MSGHNKAQALVTPRSDLWQRPAVTGKRPGDRHPTPARAVIARAQQAGTPTTAAAAIGSAKFAMRHLA